MLTKIYTKIIILIKIVNTQKKQAKEAEVKMKHCFDIMQTLIFIFKEGLEK